MKKSLVDQQGLVTGRKAHFELFDDIGAPGVPVGRIHEHHVERKPSMPLEGAPRVARHHLAGKALGLSRSFLIDRTDSPPLSTNTASSAATAKIASGIGRLLGLSNDDNELLHKAVLAHDVGYLMLDRNKLQRIISKTIISEEDFKFIQTHTKKGPKYFVGTKLPEPIKEAILYHHERNDGSGYPEGLKGPDIPLFAKITCVAETYTALISERPYREKLTSETALAVIKDGTKTKFDRDLVDALVDFVRRTGGTG